MRREPPTVVGETQEEYLYDFSFAPVEPIPQERQAEFDAAQKKWLAQWKPYSWHFRQ